MLNLKTTFNRRIKRPICEGQFMSIERRILSYLRTYGNTRENDLMTYGVQNFARPQEIMKKVIERMAIEGRLHRIVHNKLKPPEVYISLEESLPISMVMQKETVREEAKRILEEAASVAEHRNRDRDL
jgi:hypothetical protein